MDTWDLFITNRNALIGRADKAGLRDPEDTAVRAFTKFQEAVTAGRLRPDRDALFLVMSGIVRDELDSAQHRNETPTEPTYLRDIVETGRGNILTSTSITSEQWLFRSTLLGALATMPPRRAAAWLLLNVHGLTTREAGAAMGVSHQTCAVEAEAARLQLVKEVYRA